MCGVGVKAPRVRSSRVYSMYIFCVLHIAIHYRFVGPLTIYGVICVLVPPPPPSTAECVEASKQVAARAG